MLTRRATAERLEAERPGVLMCLHGHGPLDGWRARGRKRGRYCRVCNVDANRRWRERQRAAR